jgi:hypothetical protein
MQARVEAYVGAFVPKSGLYDLVLPGCGLHAYRWTGHLLTLQLLERRGALRVRTLYGTSSGAVAAVLFACGVDVDEWVERCGGVRARCRAGEWLADVYASILAEALPADAHARCSGRVVIALTRLGLVPRRATVARYASRADLLAYLHAATIIPGVTSPRAYQMVRGVRYLDAFTAEEPKGDVPALVLPVTYRALLGRIVPDDYDPRRDVVDGADAMLATLRQL